ncbi:MAG: FAD-dependent oxidoreductase, partial [Verrucomicrobia bacterium]|nr:FAD-dependent oxidoreductase [Verrucomicrobiota bacterium]
FVPWHRHVLVGTTDTPVEKAVLEPKPMEQEIEFLLTHAKRYLTKHPARSDILSVFAGLRPLVRAGHDAKTAALSRDHVILVSDSGLITIAGGKWTTYRKMAEDAVNKAILVGHLKETPCITENLPLHDPGPIGAGEAALHPRLAITAAHIAVAVHSEMARTLEDVLARRTRALFLEAKASIEVAPIVAQLLAQERKQTTDWAKAEITKFLNIAKNYCA